MKNIPLVFPKPAGKPVFSKELKMEKNSAFTRALQLLTAVVLVVFLFTSGVAFAADNPAWDKTFPPSDRVIHEKVSYPNRYGITIAADMYLPKCIDKSKKYAAIIVGTPYGGVKEQGAGIYAQTMAERGFVAIAFDESFNGESSGEPRHISSPDIFVEDFSAAVDYTGTRPFVDRNKIGVIGICGSGGFALKAAQVDRRIKAIATASMYDMSRVIRNGWKDGMSDKQRNKTLDQLGDQRWKDFEKGSPLLPPGFPGEPADSIPEGLDPVTAEFFEYYAMERGHHPRSHGPFTKTSDMAFMNFPLMNYIDTISPRPVLFIIGENAHSRYFTEDAWEMASEPKELYIVPGARHIDLYDRTDMIPFDRLTAFFTEHLK
ncbi:MAG TPA: alpha/beta hydrolase [Desulfobacteraceae bacterium]|nr:alpha/beta hydrolase [Desulfobacteraceae bacterium]HPJ69005.1 alpha/beta hydrolase [Desulfobacteraceae bacterium]HPQ29478.1 alpha/beta hydrolase [Desulfobacteraceae bacterium]